MKPGRRVYERVKRAQGQPYRFDPDAVVTVSRAETMHVLLPRGGTLEEFDDLLRCSARRGLRVFGQPCRIRPLYALEQAAIWAGVEG